MSDIKYLAKNTILIASSKITSHMVAFLMLPLYTFFLDTSEYGLMDILMTYTALLGPLLLLNLHAAMFRFLVDAREDIDQQRRVITNALDIMFMALGGLAFILVGILILVDMDLSLLLSIFLYFFAFMLSDVVVQVARGLGENKLFALNVIIQGILGALLSLFLLVVCQMGIEGIFWAFSVGCLVPAVYLVVRLKLVGLYLPSYRSKETKADLLRYSLPLIPNSISWWVFNASDRTIIFFMISAAANGVYAVSNKFSGVLYNLWGIFYLPLTESVALAINRKNRDEFLSKVFSATLRSFAALAAAGISLTAVVFPFFVDNSFAEAKQYIPVLMVAGFFNCIVGFYSTIYVAQKLTMEVMRASMIAAGINLAIILILIGFIGVWAAAISTLVAFGVTALHRHYDIKKRGIEVVVDMQSLLRIVVMMAVSISFYYMDNLLMNCIGLGATLIMAYVLNRDTIKYIRGMAFEMLGGK